MRTRFFCTLLAALCFCHAALAQTAGDCDPATDPECPPDPQPDAPGPIPVGAPAAGGGGNYYLRGMLDGVDRRREEREQEARIPLMLAAADEQNTDWFFAEPQPQWSGWYALQGGEFSGDGGTVDYELRVAGFMLGLDRLAGNGQLIGAAARYGYTRGSLRHEDIEQRSDDLSVLLYAQSLLGRRTALDGSLQWGLSRVEREVPGTENLVSRYRTRVYSAAGNLRHLRQLGATIISGALGAEYTLEDQPGFSEFGTDVAADRREVAQLIAEAEASRPLVGQLELSLALGWRYDLRRSSTDLIALGAPDDEDEFEWRLGLRLPLSAEFSSSLGFSGVQGRDNLEAWTAQWLLRWEPG